jgi:hypothetical protein
VSAIFIFRGGLWRKRLRKLSLNASNSEELSKERTEMLNAQIG